MVSQGRYHKRYVTKSLIFTKAMNQRFPQTVLLEDLVVLQVGGAEATSFLQSQLSQNISDDNTSRAVLAAYCSPNGRVLATMVVVPQASDGNPGWLLILKASGADAIEKRLRMFVLRAKVDIERLDLPVYGALLKEDTPVEALSIKKADQALWVKALQPEEVAGQRWWVLGEMPEGDQTLNPGQWQAQDITAGFAWIGKENQEQYLAQTLNLDLIDAVSFTKGCYPGQEVIARSHYRGRIKRRSAWGTIDATSNTTSEVTELIGQDTFDAQRPRNPSGRVINAAKANDRLYVLIEIRLDDLDEADYRLAAADGPKITLHPLPYTYEPVSV